MFEAIKKQFPHVAQYFDTYGHLFEQVEIPARKILLREGEVSRRFFYIEKGCLRVWFNNNGVDVTTQFFFEGQSLSSSESFKSSTPSIFTIESVEPAVIQVVFNGGEISKYFSNNYVQHVDGKSLGYDQFVSHIKAVRAATSQIKFNFKSVVQEGNVVFSNHLVYVTGKEDGQEGQAHVIGEFRFNEEGKIDYCDELTFMVKGAEKDRDLGSRL